MIVDKMKTLYLSMITGLGITVVITIAIVLMSIQSSYADGALVIGTDKKEYGVGEPISFFVEIKQTQDGIFPTAIIVNEQNQTIWHDGDLPPNEYKGTTKVYYVQQASENVPIINETGKYVLIVTYGNEKASEDLAVTELVNEDNMLHFYGIYKGIDRETGTAEIANQTYLVTTVHKTPSDLTVSNDTTIRFHGVAFTFPGCGKCLPVPTVMNPPYYVAVQFLDKTNETLVVRANMWSTISPPIDFHEYFGNGTKIFPNGTKGTWSPRLHKDPIVTVFTIHKNPQAAITVTHDSVKFLVSENNAMPTVPANGTTSIIEENTSNHSGKSYGMQSPPLHPYGPGGPAVTITLNPLEQLKSGVAARNVKCELGLQLIFKAEGNSPACVRSDTAQILVERGWAKVQGSSKMTSMDLKVYPSYFGLDSFLKGNLTSVTDPVANASIAISVNDTLMGYSRTDPVGCFQFNQWNESKIVNQINEFKQREESSGHYDAANLLFSAAYAGDDNHTAISTTRTSSMYLFAIPFPPPQYDTRLYPSSQINVTQGDSAEFKITVKPLSKYWEVGHMKLNLQRTPCGLSYRISPVNNNDSVLVNNTASFDVVLDTASYTQPGKYWMSITQDTSGLNNQSIDSNLGAFNLNVLKR